jgi:hypothetical protein
VTVVSGAALPDARRDLDAVQIARDALGEASEWLVIERGPAPHDALSIGDLVANDGAGIERVIAHWRTLNPGDPGNPSLVIGNVAWMTLSPQLLAVKRARRLVMVDLSAVRLGMFGGDDDPGRAWWPADVVVQDLDAGDDDAIVAAYRHLALQAIETLSPLVETVRARVSEGRRGLWAHVVNQFFELGPGYSDADPAPARAELDLVVRALEGTVLAHRPVVVDIPRSDGDRQMLRTTACCLAYLSPHDHTADGGEPAPARPWDDGPWAHYCMSCPLIPIEETVSRAQYWIDSEGDEH